MTSCKLIHIDDDETLQIPQFLCRACHPELIPTAESNAAFYADLRTKQAAENDKRTREREIASTRAKIDGMEKRGLTTEVATKIHASLTKKLDRLGATP